MLLCAHTSKPRVTITPPYSAVGPSPSMENLDGEAKKRSNGLRFLPELFEETPGKQVYGVTSEEMWSLLPRVRPPGLER